MSSLTLFDSTKSGQRRSVFFAIGIASAILSFTAATSAYASGPGHLRIAVGMVALGTVALLFSVAVNRGGFSWLFERG